MGVDDQVRFIFFLLVVLSCLDVEDQLHAGLKFRVYREVFRVGFDRFKCRGLS